MRTTLAALCGVFLAGCGGDDSGGGSADAANVPATITVSGTATRREGTNSNPASGATIAAYRASDPQTPVAMTTTDAQGNYSLAITTNGAPLDGYLKGTLAGFLDTYLYPPEPLVEDFGSAAVNLVTSGTLDLLSGLLCGNAQDTAKAVIGVLVVDTMDVAVAGATVSSTPAATKYCYNQGGTPNRNAMATDMDGIAYMLNVAPGQVTVSASKAGTTFRSHRVDARADVLTTTVIQP